MKESVAKPFKLEKIGVVVDSLKDMDETLCKWKREKSSFAIESVYSMRAKDIGKTLKCGLCVEKLEALQRKQFDGIIVCTDNLKKQKQMLMETYGISEKRIADGTAIFFLPANANLGTISIEETVPTDCLSDANYLFQNGYLHCRNDLEKFYFGKSHRLIYKWFHYFAIYERIFSKYRGKKIKMLEIGVFKGGSLQMWKNYFGKDAVIVGVDIDPKCKSFEEDGIHVEIGSQEDKAFLKSLLVKYGSFDIILDDGGHTMKQQITTFDTLYPKVKWGGVYVCEDCHTSYWKSGYCGGFERRGTFIEFMKERVDDLNAQYIVDTYMLTSSDKISTRFKHSKFLADILRCMPKCILQTMGLYNMRFRPYANVVNKIWSVQFYDSIVVVEKKRAEKAFAVGLLR